MIRLEGVSKTFPGTDRPAVDAIDLEVAEGSTLVLIGSSGCGKTTTLRMVNRLIEPSAGRILIGGRDVMAEDPVRLRRGIGYVIQGIGLFPHRSVADNVATVPRLLGQGEAAIARRVDEMLALVGLDPATFRDRRPASLSGGQRQRVGVARALAADPPVLLMDEPFGAVDPLVRGRLQAEVAAILKRLGKTVMLVTHDIDEAIRMGDRIGIMSEGRLVQHDAPDAVLARPADSFVADFVGPDRELRRLSLMGAGDAAEPGEAPAGAPCVAREASLQDALSVMLGAGAEAVAVEGAHPRRLTLQGIREAARVGAPGVGLSAPATGMPPRDGVERGQAS